MSYFVRLVSMTKTISVGLLQAGTVAAAMVAATTTAIFESSRGLQSARVHRPQKLVHASLDGDDAW
jgi:hypothetical protein